MTDDATELTPVPLADVLRGVLEREEITVLFQPIFDLETKAPYGYEAFARGPEQTDLEDYESLYNVANAADLLLPLDRACRRRAIIAAGRLPADYHVFVKMLPMSVGDDRFGGKDLFTLYEDELMPSQVVWQISERDPIENFSRFMDSVSDLTELGSKIGIDNFGRGYSGLDQIVHIKPQYIKLAGELIRDIHVSFVKQQLLSTFYALANKIDARLIVTGIEQMEDLEVVRRIGVHFVQGYLLARPTRGFQTTASVRI